MSETCYCGQPLDGHPTTYPATNHTPGLVAQDCTTCDRKLDGTHTLGDHIIVIENVTAFISGGTE